MSVDPAGRHSKMFRAPLRWHLVCPIEPQMMRDVNHFPDGRVVYRCPETSSVASATASRTSCQSCAGRRFASADRWDRTGRSGPVFSNRLGSPTTDGCWHDVSVRYSPIGLRRARQTRRAGPQPITPRANNRDHAPGQTRTPTRATPRVLMRFESSTFNDHGSRGHPRPP
jgi:hypothetical protein